MNTCLVFNRRRTLRWLSELLALIVPIVSIFEMPAIAQQDRTTCGVTVTTAILKNLLEAFNAHDLDRIMEFFAEDCELYMPRGNDPVGQRFAGKAAVRQGLATRFEGFPDVHYGEDRHWMVDDLGVSTWLLTGTTKAGERVRVRGVDLLEFRNGKVVKKDSYWKIVEG
jgi:ketosteroid isomerase-like protein